MVVAWGWGGRGNGELFNKYRVSVLQNEKVLEIGCTILWIYLTLLNCTLKNIQDGKFYVVCILSPKQKGEKRKERKKAFLIYCTSNNSKVQLRPLRTHDLEI